MLAILGSLVGVGLATFVLAILFVTAGNTVQEPILREARLTAASRWSISFFLGMYLFVVLQVGISRLIGSASTAFLLAVAALLLLSALRPRPTMQMLFFDHSGRRILVLATLLYVACLLVAAVIYLRAPDKPSVMDCLGSLHSGRYINLALFIADADRVPRVSQNYAQSILAAAHIFFGVRAPAASLMSWLAISQAFLILLLYGSLQVMLPPRCGAVLSVLFVMLGGTALSLRYVLVIDSGSPFLYNGYTDSVSSLATWLIFIIWLGEWIGPGKQFKLRALILPILLASAWASCAPQNILIAMCLCGVFFLLSFKRPTAFSTRRLVAVAASVGAAALLGATQGGMLMPTRLAESTRLPV